MKVIGWMIKQMDMGYIPIWMEQNMKVNGLRINSMGKD